MIFQFICGIKLGNGWISHVVRRRRRRRDFGSCVYLPINEAGDATYQSDETVRSGSRDEERPIELEMAARRGVHRENPVVILKKRKKTKENQT
jgi:hypothetical protein